MRFSCSRQRLADVLVPVNEIVPARSAKAVLQNFSITPGDDTHLYFSATDLEIGLRYCFEVRDLIDAETILVPAHRFNSLVQGDRSEDWHILTTGGKVEIRSYSGKMTLTGNVSDEFPSIPQLADDDEQVIHINGDDLCAAIGRTSFCVARGDSRYALNGIFIKIEEDVAEFVSSDMHRLSRVVCKIQNPAKVTGEGIVIPRGMGTLAKLSAGRESIAIKLTDKEMIARTSDATLVIRLVDGQFPRYRDVIPAASENTITVDREEFSQKLRLAGVLSNEETRVVRICAAIDKLLINADGGESGDAHLDIPAEVAGESVELSFNYVLMIDMLKAFSDDRITMRVKNADTPLRVDSGDFTHIVMPLSRY